MSINNLASFTESMPISRVVRELRDRGLNTTAPDRELRAELTRALFAENGIYIPPGSGQQAEAASGPTATGNSGRREVPVGGFLPGHPPAESTRLNGDFRSTGAIPRRTAHQSFEAPNGATQGRGHELGSSLPADFRNIRLGEASFNLRPGGPLGNRDSLHVEEEPQVGNFHFDHPGEFNFESGRGEGAAPGRYRERPHFAQGHRGNARPAGTNRARVGFNEAPGYRPGNQHLEEEEWLPDQEEFEARPENESQRQRRISTAFDSLRKLNIKFSGAPSEDPDEFIKSLQECRHILQVTDEELLQCIPFLLSGVARNWYRTSGAHWRSFREFEHAWLGRFTNPDFQYALREEIRARTQHPRERVTDFLTNLRCLLERLQPPMSERDQIREALRNMLPTLSIHMNMALGMNPWATWVDLERLAANVERSLIHAKQYKPPPSVDDSMLPGLAYRDSGRTYRPDRPRPVRVNAVEEEEILDDWLLGLDNYMPEEELAHLRYRNNANTTPGSRLGPEKPKSDGRCWRCGEKGHFMESCRNPRKVFCRDCGRPGVRRMNCPDCPTIREQTFCTRCGLIGPTTEECKCTSSEN